MTDNRTTELRAKLTECGVEFATDDSAASKVTMWTTQNGGWMFDCDYMEPLKEKPGTIGAKTELMIYGYTPEQAIAATLGSEREAELVRAMEDVLRHSTDTVWVSEIETLVDRMVSLGVYGCEVYEGARPWEVD